MSNPVSFDSSDTCLIPFACIIYSYLYQSQAARQGLAVLMATAVVVLKHETSTTNQSPIYE